MRRGDYLTLRMSRELCVAFHETKRNTNEEKRKRSKTSSPPSIKSRSNEAKSFQSIERNKEKREEKGERTNFRYISIRTDTFLIERSKSGYDRKVIA